MNKLCGLSILLTTLALASGLLAAERPAEIGDDAPAWKDLLGVDGERHSLADYGDAKVLVVAFISNHCPVSQVYEGRLKRLVRDYGGRGVRLVAINCSNSPDDRLEPMRARARVEKFNFPYLHDPTQQIGRAYGATVTPEVFVLDAERRIAYAGLYDDNPDVKRVNRNYVVKAVEALLAGNSPEISKTEPLGCDIPYADEQPVRGHTTDGLPLVQQRLERGEAVLLDVREQNEWDAGHLEVTQLVPLSRLRREADDAAAVARLREELPVENVVYCHCRSGGRVLPASRILRSLGYDARPLKAGYADLLEAGFTKAQAE